jgi:uncharacterized protein (TIGR01244 family)
MTRLVAVVALAATGLVGCAREDARESARKETLDGVRNFTVVDASIGCAGATEIRAIPALAARGYKAIVNIRLETESGAAIEASRAAATSAGMRFVHLPFSGSAPDPAVVDSFLAAIADPANQPAFVNCSSANRVAALWLTKRMLIDHWDRERAVEEARFIGLSIDSLEAFAVDYVAKRRKGQPNAFAPATSSVPTIPQTSSARRSVSRATAP